MYYRPETDEVFTTHSEIRMSFLRGNSIVMFAGEITDHDLEARGVFVLARDMPEITATQVAVPTTVKQVDGVWTQEYTVRDKTPEEVEADKPSVPFSVTRRQARQALAIKGMLDNVEAAIAALDDGTPAGKQKALLVKIEWQDSLNFERHRPMVVAIGAAVGLSSSELDDLFRFADTL